jgi:hypothetical protein
MVRVYTPQVVITAEHAAFLVSLNTPAGLTSVPVISGRVHAGILENNKFTHVSAPYQLDVGKEGESLAPILKNRFDSLATCIPDSLLDRYVTRHMSQAKRNQRVIMGKTENAILAIPLENGSGYSGPWNISKGLMILITAMLEARTPFVQTILSEDVPDNAFALAEHEKAQYLLSGMVEKFEIIKFGILSVSADDYDEYNSARIKLSLRLVKVAGRDTLLDRTFTGETNGKLAPINTWAVIDSLPFDMNNAGFISSIMGRSVQQLVEQCATVLSQIFKN